MVKNYRLERCGYSYNGHLNRGQIRLEFKDFFLLFDVHEKNKIRKLFDIFEINCEDGTFIRGLEGKYCRVESEDFTANKIMHITDDIELIIK